MKSSADPHCFITAPKDGIKPPGGRRSTKRTERPPAIITATLIRRLSSSLLKRSSVPQGGPLMSAWAMLLYQEPQSAHETAQKNEETSASSEQVKTWPEY